MRALRHLWHSYVFDPENGFGIWAKLVGCALIEHADSDGVAFPSLPVIGEYAGCTSRMTVLKGLGELEEAGLLQVTRRTGQVNRYRLVLAVGIPRANTSPSRGRVPVHEPVHEPVHAGGLEPKEPVEPLRASHVRANAQALVAHYVDRWNAAGVDPVPSALIGKAAGIIKRLVDDGVAEATIVRAIDLLVERGKDPALLPSFVPEAVTGTSRSGYEHPVDRRFRETYGFAAAELNRARDASRPTPHLRALPPGEEAS